MRNPFSLTQIRAFIADTPDKLRGQKINRFKNTFICYHWKHGANWAFSVYAINVQKGAPKIVVCFQGEIL